MKWAVCSTVPKFTAYFRRAFRKCGEKPRSTDQAPVLAFRDLRFCCRNSVYARRFPIFSPHFRKARLNRASRSENHRIFVSTQMRSLFCQAESCIQTKKRADASALFRCRPKASSAIDLIQIDITCLTTITSTSRSRPCSIIPLPGWCLASTSHIAYMKKGQHSQFESVTLKAPKELLYCRKILYTIFP